MNLNREYCYSKWDDIFFISMVVFLFLMLLYVAIIDQNILTGFAAIVVFVFVLIKINRE